MNTEKLSLTMGKRLKSERERLGLSHEKLRSAILEKYGVEISKDSLINYEVSDEHHTKAYKNNGMRVEYLRYFADFYGVSADWLLGLTNTRSQDIEIKQICEKIGLEEQVIIQLQGIYEGRDYEPETIEGINSILSSSIFQLLARDYVRLKRFTEKVTAEYKEHSFGELEDPIHEEGEVITLKGCRACDYYRSKIIDQFSIMLDMDIPVYQTTTAYFSLLEEGLEKI